MRIRSGSPPTLWWLLIIDDCPTIDTDSMTSGYSVPCARKSTWPSFAASASNTSMNVAPMIFRFFSGIGDAGEPVEKQRRRVDEHQRQLQPLVALADLRRLVVPQDAVVDEDAGQLVCRPPGG